MKRYRKILGATLIVASVLLLLDGCGGYAHQPGGASGVQMYGTVDVGVSHESR